MDKKKLEKLISGLVGDVVSFKEADKVFDYLLKLNEMNLTYFLALYEQKVRPRKKETLRIQDTAFPTAIASPEMMKQVPFVNYSDLLAKTEDYARIARPAALWVKKTQGGGGTSVLRTQYLSRVLGTPESEVKLGAKGTDLFVEASGRRASLAEIQILQSLSDLRDQVFSRIYFHDIVSTESQPAIHELWKKPCLMDESVSYEKAPSKFKGFTHFSETFQSVLPTLDEEGKLTLNRLAPGGHAFFAVEALLNALHAEQRPQPGNAPLISVIGNGEDLGSTPDAAMVGWMIDTQAAIVMITTEKTEIDLKGGQIALVSNGDGTYYIALIEQAQAKEAGQLELFEKLGLQIKERNQIAFFNTNMALFNYEVLVPKLKSLVDRIGEKEFLEIITPTLIENKKIQKDPQGVTRVYEQLEGAMGSTLLNLDRYWRRHFKEPLVHFINVDRMDRTKFFSPVKTAFDYFMQFHSDRFELDTQTMRLKNLRPGKLPLVNLDHPGDKTFYSEVQNILECFKGSKIADLDALTVTGPVDFSGVTLKGKVTVKNHNPRKVRLLDVVTTPGKVLQNCIVEILRDGKAKIQ